MQQGLHKIKFYQSMYLGSSINCTQEGGKIIVFHEYYIYITSSEDIQRRNVTSIVRIIRSEDISGET